MRKILPDKEYIVKDKKIPPHPENKELTICYICGREIVGECVVIKTKRHSELHIHFECVRKGERKHEG